VSLYSRALGCGLVCAVERGGGKHGGNAVIETEKREGIPKSNEVTAHPLFKSILHRCARDTTCVVI
jgi:hypothetical protein